MTTTTEPNSRARTGHDIMRAGRTDGARWRRRRRQQPTHSFIHPATHLASAPRPPCSPHFQLCQLAGTNTPAEQESVCPAPSRQGEERRLKWRDPSRKGRREIAICYTCLTLQRLTKTSPLKNPCAGQMGGGGGRGTPDSIEGEGKPGSTIWGIWDI